MSRERSFVLTCLACGEPLAVEIHVESHGAPGWFREPTEGALWHLLHATCEACGHVHTDDDVSGVHEDRIQQLIRESTMASSGPWVVRDPAGKVIGASAQHAWDAVVDCDNSIPYTAMPFLLEALERGDGPRYESRGYVVERIGAPPCPAAIGGVRLVEVSTKRPNDVRVTVPVADAYLIWSHEHNAWWGPNFGGYWIPLLGAGLYTKEAAEAECGKRYGGQRPDEEVRRLVDELSRWREMDNLGRALYTLLDAAPKAGA